MRARSSRILALVLLAGIRVSIAASAGDAPLFISGRPLSDFQTVFDRETKEGRRPVSLQCADIDGRPTISALFIDDQHALDWITRSALPTKVFNQELKQQAERGFRPVSMTAAVDGRSPRFSMILVRDGGTRAWEVENGLTAPELRRAFATLSERGLRAECVSGYPAGKSIRYLALVVEAAGQESAVRLDLSPSEARAFLSDAHSRGMRPVSISSWRGSDGPHFAIVAVNDGQQGTIRFDVPAKDRDVEIPRLAPEGFRPRSAVEYLDGEHVRFAVLYEQPASLLPVTGDCPESLSSFDKALQDYLRDSHIRGATLAVSRNGRLLLTRGYGFKDAEEREPMPPDALLRIASVTKPFTAMAIQKLIREGKLEPSTPVRAFLAIDPPSGADVDPRWEKITVKNLLDHRGGWDSKAPAHGHEDGFDPMFYPREIGEALKVPPPLAPKDFVRYMLGQPLQFDPGERYAYSNFGYCLLGRVIEKASGMTYSEYIVTQIGEPLGAKDIRLGHTRPSQRDPREPVYHAAGETEDVLDAQHEMVRWPDGGFVLEAMDSHGGLIASSPDLIKVFDAWWMDGVPRAAGQRRRWVHFGSLPGTFCLALQRPDGITAVVLLNQRSGKAEKDEKILEVIDKTIDQITDWPEP